MIPSALGAIQNRVGNQRQGLDRRVHGKFGTAVLAKGIHPWVIPDVCAITTKTPQLDIVDMWRGTLLENKHQFVLRSVEAAHAGISLCPDTKVFKLAVWFGGRFQ